ncbi:FliO/MopB family protein [Desulfospira joergensenii]|uniref:FliO/MopB family protein n=1 Tax=Desulfospira joergensenii TaxID=53329 RepID=UPI0003B3E722|nr:flagellar biosynthetic protein FliO [Desulfospira joergensenii]
MMTPDSIYSSLAAIFAILGFLILILFAIKKYGTRLGMKQLRQNRTLVLEDRISLGQKRDACVVRFREKTYLLGVTDHHISLLAAFDNPPEQEGPER